jgi:hypothetical protein
VQPPSPSLDDYGHCATSTETLDRLGSPPHCVSIALQHCVTVLGTAPIAPVRCSDCGCHGLLPEVGPSVYSAPVALSEWSDRSPLCTLQQSSLRMPCRYAG